MIENLNRSAIHLYLCMVASMEQHLGPRDEFPFDRKQKGSPALLAMIHLGALPGTPHAHLHPQRIARQAAVEAQLYQSEGVDGLLIENMHDRPYLKRKVGPEITAAITLAAAAVRRAAPGLPIGLQVLAGANRDALAIAYACGLDFIRVESFVFGHLADEGWMDSDAGSLLRYRRQIGANMVGIWADVQKKHASHAVTADLSLKDWAREAEFAGASALIVTGKSTGMPADPADLESLRPACRLPLVIGSGINAENALQYAKADAWIVGSSLKRDGRWNAEPDAVRVRQMVQLARPSH